MSRGTPGSVASVITFSCAGFPQQVSPDLAVPDDLDAHAGMVALSADITPSDTGYIGTNVAWRLSSFALIVLTYGCMVGPLARGIRPVGSLYLHGA